MTQGFDGEAHVHDTNGAHEIPVSSPPIEAATAFLVVVMPDGVAVAYSDVNTSLNLQREAHLNDMYAGAAQVMRDVTIMQMTQTVVQNTVAGLMQVMQAQMEAVQNQQIAKQVLSGNRSARRH